MTALLATLASAALMWAAFPPLDLGFLIFVAPAPFLWALRHVDRPGRAAWLGFVFGAAFFGALLRWIILLGAVAFFPLVLAEALYAALFAAVVWIFRALPPTRWWLVTVGAWALWEFSRERWPFGGFPWGALGNGIGGLAWPRGAAQWIGTTGWSVVAVGVAAGVALLADAAPARLPLRISIGSALAFTLLGTLWPPSADGEPFSIAIVQGGSPCPRVHCPNENRLILESHLELTRSLQPGTLDLVVWSENSTGSSTSPVTNPQVFADLSAEARRLDSNLLVSGTRVAEDPDRFINANLLLSRRGDLIGEYMKRHPVPYGEYVPFRDALTFIPQLDAVPRDMVRGDRPVVWDLPEGVLGSVISFEGAFARTVRSVSKEGAEILVVLSNEGSYGRSEASDQFIGLTRMRAAELGTPLIHGAITGKSTLIDADGSLGETTSLFVPEVLLGELRWRTAGPTLYARLGDWLQIAAIVAGIVAPVWRPQDRPTRLFTPPWAHRRTE